MSEIVKLNYPNLHETLLSYALETFYSLHDDENLQKKPSTPELLSWIQILQTEYPGGIEEGSLDSIPHRETLVKYYDDNKHLEKQEQIGRNAEKIWELMTPAEKGEYLIEGNNLYQEDDFSQRIMSSTGLDYESIYRAVSYLRSDEARLDEWTSSEEGSTWREEYESNADDGDDDDDDDDDDDYDEYDEEN